MRAVTAARLLGLVAIAVLAGCATMPARTMPARTVLAAADDELAQGHYKRALQLYDEFLAQHPRDQQAPRARGTRDVLAGLVTARAEVERLRAEGQHLRSEREQLRQEAERLRTERERLRTDLERLRSIDLREPRR